MKLKCNMYICMCNFRKCVYYVIELEWFISVYMLNVNKNFV